MSGYSGKGGGAIRPGREEACPRGAGQGKAVCLEVQGTVHRDLLEHLQPGLGLVLALRIVLMRGSLSGISWQGVFLPLFALPGSWDQAVLDAVCAESALWVPPGSSLIQPCSGLPQVNVWQEARVAFRRLFLD